MTAPRDPGLYGRSFAEVYDDWYADLDDPYTVARAFGRHLPRGATVVEFGAGTGRLCDPLVAAGFETVALDVSAAMLRRSGTTRRLASDMANCALRGEMAHGVLIAYNTLFNLEGPSVQAACLREAARVLRPDGWLAVEAFIASAGPQTGVGVSTRAHPSRADGVVAILAEPTGAGRDREIRGAHIELLPEATHTRPWRLSYLDPARLDELAVEAGLAPDHRAATWGGDDFDPGGDRYISWFRRR